MRLRFSALQRAEIAEIILLPASAGRADAVSVLFNEPKLLKFRPRVERLRGRVPVSVLFNEPKLLKSDCVQRAPAGGNVSVLFNEPKLLKSTARNSLR